MKQMISAVVLMLCLMNTSFAQQPVSHQLPAALEAADFDVRDSALSAAESERVRGKLLLPPVQFTFRTGRGLSIDGIIGSITGVFGIAPVGDSFAFDASRFFPIPPSSLPVTQTGF